jgi:sterol desaturase/sphingolipid hydroxylase (fatty acid hydroxylase superfamily)
MDLLGASLAPPKAAMGRPAFFELWLNLYIVGGIVVVGPLGMLALDRLSDRAVARGWLQRASASPVKRVGLQDLKFMASFIIVTGLLATAVQLALFQGRSIPLDLSVHPLEMLWFTTALMLLVDTNGFFWHLFSHRNQQAFRAFHSGHHMSKGRLHIAVAFYSNTLWDYPLHSGILLSLGLSVLVLATGHYAVVTIVYATTVYVLGVAITHSGLRETPAVKWALRVILLPIRIVPTAIRLEDHERHHAQGDCNYGVFFSHWDRLFRTWQPTTAPARPAQ